MSNDSEKVKAPRKKRSSRAKSSDSNSDTPAPKKRGRKPKGGKVVKAPTVDENVVLQAANVILHLKCGSDDLKNADFFSNKCYEYDPSDLSGKIDPYEENLFYRIGELLKIKRSTLNKIKSGFK